MHVLTPAEEVHVTKQVTLKHQKRNCYIYYWDFFGEVSKTYKTIQTADGQGPQTSSTFSVRNLMKPLSDLKILFYVFLMIRLEFEEYSLQIFIALTSIVTVRTVWFLCTFFLDTTLVNVKIFSVWFKCRLVTCTENF